MGLQRLLAERRCASSTAAPLTARQRPLEHSQSAVIRPPEDHEPQGLWSPAEQQVQLEAAAAVTAACHVQQAYFFCRKE